MKKIFYKIFLILLVITYIPLISLYSFHGFYMKSYVEKQKISELKEIVYFVDNEMLKKITEEQKIKMEKKKSIKIEVFNTKGSKAEVEFFKYLNEKFWQIDFENMKINDIRIKFNKMNNLLNRVYIIKKVSDSRYLIISSLMINPEVIYKIILSSYFILHLF